MPPLVIGRKADPGGHRDVPVVGYRRIPGQPPVSVLRWPPDAKGGAPPSHGAHAHDFLVLLYVESGEGGLRVDEQDWQFARGDVFVIAPGAVVAPGMVGVATRVQARMVFFPSDAVDPDGPGSLASWRTHPLLLPFARGQAMGGQRLRIPPSERAEWSRQLRALGDELDARHEGYADAVRALLTLLLVRLARLAPDAADDLRLRNEPLMGSVFDIVETRFSEPLSLRDVADAVGLSPGHLTTVVGRRTGRTVQQWIIERRMRAARQLLTGTDLTIETVSARVGYRDAGYFSRHFRRIHGVGPTEWRRAGGVRI